MTPPPSSRAYGPTRRGLLRAGAVAALGITGQACGPSRRPGPARSVYVPTGTTLPGDAERIERALAAWDALGYPALALRVELRDPHPQTIPPNCVGCDPAIPITGTGSGLAIAYTLPGASVVCTRGEEWALVHECLHVLHQQEGAPPDLHHTDGDPVNKGRWPRVDAAARALRGSP